MFLLSELQLIFKLGKATLTIVIVRSFTDIKDGFIDICVTDQ